MGNFFKKVPTQKFDDSLIQFLKTRKLSHINDAILMINDNFPTSSTLALDEYFDVFAGLLDDYTEQVFTLLESDHNLDGRVDVYESLAAIIVFCGEDFNVKLQFIFGLFDFDKSGEIELKEMVMTFQTSVRALCKMVYIEIPSLDELEYFAQKLFHQVDTDKNRSVSYKEFTTWMCNSWDLQDFLLMYAMIQTQENAQRRTKENLIFYEKLFDKVKSANDEAETTLLQQVFAMEMKYLEKNVLNLLLQTLEDSSREFMSNKGGQFKEGFICKEPYMEVMQAWAAFDATDINHDNQTSITELKYLIYAYEGDMPDVFRVSDEMQTLDKDNSGFVSRQEWINYLCQNAESQGKAIFRGNLKKMFNKFDKDNSGTLNIREIKELLKDNLRDHVLKFKYRSKADQKDFESMIDSLAEEIVRDLNKDGDSSISWIEFKHFMELSYKKQEKLKQFLTQL